MIFKRFRKNRTVKFAENENSVHFAIIDIWDHKNTFVITAPEFLLSNLEQFPSAHSYRKDRPLNSWYFTGFAVYMENTRTV